MDPAGLFRPAALTAAILLPPAAATGQTVVDLDTPDLDRWNYPFNSTPGTDDEVPSFGALGVEFFDDRESQVLVGFDTGGLVQTGLGLAAYDVQSATLTLTVADGVFPYDPTPDPFETRLPETDPDFQPDADAGRPVELFGAAFRNGFTAETFEENSPFAPEGNPPFTRNAFATDFESNEPRAVCNNVRERFPVTPFAVGTNPAVTPGDAFPINADMMFDLDLANPNVERFLQEALQMGRIRLMVASLHPATQPPGTSTQSTSGQTEGTSITYPIFFARESKFSGPPFNFAARLDMVVEIGDPADLNGDGAVDGADLGLLLLAWDPTGPVTSPADLDVDSTVDGADLGLLLLAWSP